MTGDWRRELAKLDDVDPPSQRPRRPRSATVGRSPGSRVSAGLVALAIVGLGAALFVSAYRGAGDVPPPGGAVPSASAGTTTYRDALGWSVDHPSDWFVLPIDWFNGRYSTWGAALSNEPLPAASEDAGEGSPWPDLSQLSHDGAVLIVTHRAGGPAPTVDDDSTFPLDPADAQLVPGDDPASSILNFRGDGLEFTALFGGYADAPPELLETVDSMVGSIRFQPWEPGEIRNGYEAVGASVRDGRAGSALVQRYQLVYVMKQGPGRAYLLDVPELNCEGQNQDWDPDTQEIVMESPCFAEVRYDVDGIPHPANPPRFSVPIRRIEPIRAWDGSLLVPVRGSG
jgi:hypothetical protein